MLVVGWAAAEAKGVKYIADSPVADVIYCSETANEDGMINRKMSGDWTIRCGDTVTVVGRQVVRYFTDSIHPTNIYAIIDDNGHRLYTEARFLTPVDPEKDLFAEDEFRFSPGFLYDLFGKTWDLRSGKGRGLYSLWWPAVVLALMLVAAGFLAYGFVIGFNDWISACAPRLAERTTRARRRATPCR